ncbi:DUF4133 domain-containing protein [Pedobacter paludis]|uniref:DUF4133 domain-containing protein n=1 Tax=Pedobacter paludis TaxID=2203212 RepID=A0A317EZB4_9SPHI|nr:DUF4133 domain-containing protein [Pedobacter paludis]PWS32194.1 hypothetical protein DF947_10520 [Pedobacter paludis]
MANSVYQINKGINKSIEFKGLKAQYIFYMGGAMIGLILVFFILYYIGIPQYLALGIVLAGGGGMIYYIYGLSHKYGEHGMMKVLAKRAIPKRIKIKSRSVFINMNGKSTSVKDKKTYRKDNGR